jgi:2-polyprenyl-6-methoxyphenol hydroxylase-like FAD-dependent oxidoreductase
MTKTSLRILIVGGGPGGLCLAQGLRQAGIDVALYERDATAVFRKQGYRLHIDERGAGPLRACLPAHLFELFTATASARSHQVTVLNKQLKTLKVIGSPKLEATTQTSFSAGVDRLTLRDILLTSLEGVVFFGKEFTHYEQLSDGSVQAYFADGTTARGDVLVGADGVNSRIRQQFLPDATPVDTGSRCIYGKVLLTDATRPFIPDPLYHGFTQVVSSHASLALGLIAFPRPPIEIAAQLAPEVQLHTTGSYLMWSLNTRSAPFVSSDDELFRMGGTALLQKVLQYIKSWHPNLQALMAAGDPAEIFPIAVRVAAPCEPWQSNSITLLGDAIHAMSPAGGSGANMALHDAHLLCEALISVARFEQPLTQAIHAYEAQMLKDGFEAVRFSSQGGVLHNASTPRKRSWLPALLPFARRT